MNIGFYAGSFDPFTNGHMHVTEVSSKLFDEVIIGIGINNSKKRRYDVDVMKNAIEAALKAKGLDNVRVISYDNLSVDTAISNGATCFIRGIRNGMDYDFEENLASLNEELSDLDTIYIRAGKLGYISSTMVQELVTYNRDISKYVPKEIAEVIMKARKQMLRCTLYHPKTHSIRTGALVFNSSSQLEVNNLPQTGYIFSALTPEMLNDTVYVTLNLSLSYEDAVFQEEETEVLLFDLKTGIARRCNISWQYTGYYSQFTVSFVDELSLEKYKASAYGKDYIFLKDSKM